VTKNRHHFNIEAIRSILTKNMSLGITAGTKGGKYDEETRRKEKNMYWGANSRREDSVCAGCSEWQSVKTEGGGEKA